MIYRTSRVVTTRLTTSKIICRYRGRAGAQAAVEGARSASVGRRVEECVTASLCERFTAGRIVDPSAACWVARMNTIHPGRQPSPRMIVTIDPSLQSALDALAFPGIVIGHRLISPGDEDALLPEEAPAFASSIVKVRRASGAARIVARQLLKRLGQPECALPRTSGGAPAWPAGVVGSLAHDSRVAVAAVGMGRDVGAIGIDVEPAESLPSELLDLVATPQERLRLGDDPYHGRMLFVAKEAVYKAVYPLDQTFLDHHDVQISFAERKAVVRNGRVVELRFCIAAHLVALAFLPGLR
jgi:4'-phosphopantetheinyl transferase EntD